MEMTYKLLSDHPDIQSKLNMTESELRTIKGISNRIKLPASTDGLIPQFDGYFELSKTLEVDGNGIAKGFQMKESGLYHESQVIKQPDVMMLFTYLNLPNINGDSKTNWAYYEPLCEASSSLTYPAHAIASIDQMEQSKFYEYWKKSIQIDIIDLHKEAHLGLHAACMAGGWYSIYRGLFGFEAESDYLVVNPKVFNNWKQVSIQFMYHGQLVQAYLSNETLTIQSDSQFKIMYHHQIFQHTKTTVIPMNVSGRN
jgi:trehalose/maltose hydrolase-like predicted phosphorylase